MSANKIRKGDEVVVLTGKDKVKRGTVSQWLSEKLIVVGGINRVKKHVKPNPMKGENGGIIEKEMPIQISNVALFNTATQKADRVGFKVLDDGRKVRVFKSNGEVVDA
jgi:large subunit ribosomal protein L24